MHNLQQTYKQQASHTAPPFGLKNLSKNTQNFCVIYIFFRIIQFGAFVERIRRRIVSPRFSNSNCMYFRIHYFISIFVLYWDYLSIPDINWMSSLLHFASSSISLSKLFELEYMYVHQLIYSHISSHLNIFPSYSYSYILNFSFFNWKYINHSINNTLLIYMHMYLR